MEPWHGFSQLPSKPVISHGIKKKKKKKLYKHMKNEAVHTASGKTQPNSLCRHKSKHLGPPPKLISAAVFTDLIGFKQMIGAVGHEMRKYFCATELFRVFFCCFFLSSSNPQTALVFPRTHNFLCCFAQVYPLNTILKHFKLYVHDVTKKGILSPLKTKKTTYSVLFFKS